MSHKKTPVIPAAAIVAVVTVGGLVPMQAQTVPDLHKPATATVDVDENGRITAPVIIDDTDSSDTAQVLWHNYVNCRC